MLGEGDEGKGIRWRFMKPAWLLPKALAFGCVFAVVGGCISSFGRVPTETANDWTSKDLVVHFDSEVPSDNGLLRELEALRETLTTDLDLPRSDIPIHVYLFESADTYRAFMNRHYPGLPHRRAYFVESNSKLAVYAQWDRRIQEDLRHELTHGYLHAAIADLPLWLDEGIAEYYEVPATQKGLNQQHVAYLLQQYESTQWRPDLARLAKLDSSQDMTQLDYAEAWAWVHWLMASRQRQQWLIDSVKPTESPAPDSALSETIEELRPNAASELFDYLRRL